MERYQFKIKDLDCAMCAKKVEDKLNAEDWVEQAVLNFTTEKLVITTERKGNILPAVQKIAKSVEPDCKVTPLDQDGSKIEKKKLNWFYPVFFVGFAIGLAGVLIDKLPQLIDGLQSYTILATVFMWVGGVMMLTKTLVRACLKLLRSHSVDENLLVSISVIGALAINEGMEGLMVIVLYQIGKFFEQKAVDKTRNSVKSLMMVKPEKVSLKVGTMSFNVPIADVKKGSVIVVKAGEIVPLDGIVVSGKCTLDVSSLTGESVPLEIAEGKEIMSGSVNLDGIIEIKTTSIDSDSTITKILAMLETASERKAKSETIVTRVTKYYVPAVIICAIAVALGFGLSGAATVKESLYKGMIFLVVSCPCAVAISVPLAYFCGIGNASKNGILVKGTNYLDNISNVKKIVFDKTGTITTGNFSVQDVKVQDDAQFDKEEIMRLVYFAEKNSTHPIARAILTYLSPSIMTWNENPIEMIDFKEEAGKGITYITDNHKIAVGKGASDLHYTTVSIDIDDKQVATIYLSDTIKQGTSNAIDYFKQNGISTEMLTGDNEMVASAVAKEVGFDTYKSGLLPKDKFDEMESLLSAKAKNTDMIAYVGDGINDAPVLGRADIGIAMGLSGSAATVDTADVVLMNDDLSQLITLRKLSKRTRFTVGENVYATLIIKLTFVILGLCGITGLAWAVFADVGLTICTILNALRVLGYKAKAKNK